MIIPDLISQPFAESGDKLPPPQASADGFVNFTEGYTPFYEIDLAANNPKAKPVERRVQNYLFNAATKNLQAWQQLSYAPWISSMPGGYADGAFVVREGIDGKIRPFRCLQNGNVADPRGGSNWELMRTQAEQFADIPMPAGGDISKTIAITVATDANTLTKGTYAYASTAIATASPNVPSIPGRAAVAGVMEVLQWAINGVDVVWNRYTDNSGNVYIRNATNNTFTTWRVIFNTIQLLGGTANFGTMSGSTSVYSISVGTQISLVDGMEVKATIQGTAATSNAGAATLNVGGSGAKPILGGARLPLQGGELIGTYAVTFRYDVAADAWIIVNSAAGRLQVMDATKDNHAPGWKQVKDYVATQVVVDWVDVRNKPDVVIADTVANLLSVNLRKRAAGDSNPSIIFRNNKDIDLSTYRWLVQGGAGNTEDNLLFYSTGGTQEFVLSPGKLTAKGGFAVDGTLEFRSDAPVIFYSVTGSKPLFDIQKANAALSIGTINDSGNRAEVLSVQRGTGQFAFSVRPSFNAAVPYDNKNLYMIGATQEFSHSNVPLPWMFADGRAISRTTYAEYFAAVGTTYGAGDGSTTFNIPDYRNRFTRGSSATRAPGSIEAQSVELHAHTASAATAGSHAHTATSWTDTQGNHAHSASTAIGADGYHAHSIIRALNSDVGGGGPYHTTANGVNGYTAGTDAGGTHAHAASTSIGAAGNHAHNVGTTITAAGDHAHTITVNGTGGAETRPANIATARYVYVGGPA